MHAIASAKYLESHRQVQRVSGGVARFGVLVQPGRIVCCVVPHDVCDRQQSALLRAVLQEALQPLLFLVLCNLLIL